MMKKTILTLFCLIGMMGVSAQQTWNFTVTPDDDVAALKRATDSWTYDETKDRFQNVKAISGAVKAGSTELLMTQGLTVEAAGEKLRIDVNKELQLAGKNVTIGIPGLKAGQTVTVVFASTGNTAVTFDAITNLKDTSGFTEADKTITQTGTGTVAEDGTVTLASTAGSVNVFSISVSEASQTPGDDPDPAATMHDVARNTKANQALFTLKDGGMKYYNTDDVERIDMDVEKVAVTMKGYTTLTQDVYDDITAINFAKKEKQDDPEQPGEIVNGDLKITEAKGWMESLYAKWELLDGADNYAVYVKGGQYSTFTKIDGQLVRNYGTYGRADVVGLKAGTYELKVVPMANGTEVEKSASSATGIEVRNYSRQGFAFMGGYAPGAYQSDGALKPGAKVIYVTKATAKTVSTSVVTSTKGGVTECTGLQAIIAAYEKGCDTTPIAFRFIGLIDASDIDSFGSKEEGIQVKGKRADSEMNITFEGIGDDATLRGFGFLVRNAKSVEFRNFAIMRCMDDGVSLDTDNANIWVHHLDLFYGKHGSGDHDKGDGSVDVKSDSKHVTVSYCRYWDTGKTNMFGMKSESGPNYISYDHNWFDHSDSRHPRVRTMSVHVWNNYFDNVAKYGVGATTGASVFVENNYFLNTKKPILSSKQGTDALGSGTFSGEDGGMIKAYGNHIDRTAAHFSYYTQKAPSTAGYDAYETATRQEQVPATETTLQGGTTYNNFDTDAAQMYTYTAADAADVPAIVTGYYGAGRLNHGDITYTFKPNVGNDNTDSAYDAVLGTMLNDYQSTLVGIFSEDGTDDTAVNTIKASANTATVYKLNGQPTTNPRKGIHIVNGKTAVFK
jgi:pectate lyase